MGSTRLLWEYLSHVANSDLCSSIKSPVIYVIGISCWILQLYHALEILQVPRLIFYQTSGTLSDSFKGNIKVLQLVAVVDLCGFVRFLSFLRSFCLFLIFSLLPHQALSDCAGSTRVVALSDSVRLCWLYQTQGFVQLYWLSQSLMAVLEAQALS